MNQLVKTHAKNPFLLTALICGLGLLLAGRATAQTFKTLHIFTVITDGAFPGEVCLSGDTVYGAALDGGTNGLGSVFAVNTNGMVFKTLHSFTGSSDGVGANGVILSGNTLYGTAIEGGTNGYGTVFAISTNGAGFRPLHTFTVPSSYAGINSDGAFPFAGLVSSGNTLYGTASVGGTNGNGTVFAINTNGMGFMTLHSFSTLNYDSDSTSIGYESYTNSDGANPQAGLILSGSTLYGTAPAGGTNGYGTVFAVNTNGTGFMTLYSFTPPGYNGVNSDGANPYAGLILSGNTLYGTARSGGSSGNGTVFAVNTDGTGFTNLYSFTATNLNTGINSDGADPQAGLVLSGNTLYGTAIEGGTNGYGTVFAVNTNGTSFTTLHSFTVGSDGANPYAGLILSGNTLYGTAQYGGTNGYGTLYSGAGTVFSISLESVSVPQPQLFIHPSGTNVILTWPTNAIGFTLQSTINLVSPAVWSTNLPPPIVESGQNVVTNTISVQRKFYRLMHQ